MTLNIVLKKLADIDCQFQTLIRDIGIDEYHGLRDVFTLNRKDPNERFLFNELNDLMASLYCLHEKLSYLLMPCSDTHILKRYPSGRYGYDAQPFDEGRTFSCGSHVEALIYDEHGCPRWVSSRIEHNGTDYYLYGYSGIPLNGLSIRERGYTA